MVITFCKGRFIIQMPNGVKSEKFLVDCGSEKAQKEQDKKIELFVENNSWK